MSVKLIITDIDGVWTDGGMFYSESGEEFKKFNTSDGVGVLLAKKAGIKLYIISGENSTAVRNRAKKLKIKNCHVGIKDKVALVEKILVDEGLTYSDIAFIGDEINDIDLLKKVGFSACPQSAPNYTKEIVHAIIPTNGGEGAFRDFVIEILKREGNLLEYFDSIC